MLAALRAGLLTVPLLLAAISTAFADKPFQRDDLMPCLRQTPGRHRPDPSHTYDNNAHSFLHFP